MSIDSLILHLSQTLPFPVFALLMSVAVFVFLVVGVLLLALIYLLGGILVEKIRMLGFFALDIEEIISRWADGASQPKSPKPRGKISNSYRNDPENRRLQADLLVLLKGDVATAKRLLMQQRRLSPGMSDNWYLEKVIYDLERDRR